MENQIADTRMLLTLKTVQRQLIRLFNHFPGHGRTISNLEIIAPDYLGAFKGIYDSEFINLVDIAIRGQRFFPVIDDLEKIRVEEQRWSYNPYGGSGGFPLAEDVTRELTEGAKEPHQGMSEENKKLFAEFFGKIGKNIES